MNDTPKPQKCDACNGRGWILSFISQDGLYTIQRCDKCWVFDSDEAAGKSVENLLPLAPELLEKHSDLVLAAQCFYGYLASGGKDSETFKQARQLLLTAINESTALLNKAKEKGVTLCRASRSIT